MRTGGHRDMMKLIVAFPNFASESKYKEPKICALSSYFLSLVNTPLADLELTSCYSRRFIQASNHFFEGLRWWKWLAAVFQTNSPAIFFLKDCSCHFLAVVAVPNWRAFLSATGWIVSRDSGLELHSLRTWVEFDRNTGYPDWHSLWFCSVTLHEHLILVYDSFVLHRVLNPLPRVANKRHLGWIRVQWRI